LSAQYEIEPLADKDGYRFITTSGDIYITYFTEFTLLDPSGEDITAMSFGFTCNRADEEKRQHYDSKVKHTLIDIIQTFFNKQDENAILYFCMNNDGKARNRQITFNRWFLEFSENIEKHNSSDAHGKLGFYGSILFKKDNLRKQKLIESFYFTLNYWGLDNR